MTERHNPLKVAEASDSEPRLIGIRGVQHEGITFTFDRPVQFIAGEEGSRYWTIPYWVIGRALLLDYEVNEKPKPEAHDG